MGLELPAPAFAAATLAVTVVPAAAATAATPAAFEAAEVAVTAAAAAATASTTVAAAAEATTAAAGTATAEAATTAAKAARATAAETAAATREAARLGLEAIAAVDGTVSARLEWHLRFFPTRCANRIEQLARGPAIAAAEPTCVTILLFLQPAAVGTTPRLPGEPLGCMELLFTRCEHERLAAIAADERLVGVRHPIDLLDLTKL